MTTQATQVVDAATWEVHKRALRQRYRYCTGNRNRRTGYNVRRHKGLRGLYFEGFPAVPGMKWQRRVLAQIDWD